MKTWQDYTNNLRDILQLLAVTGFDSEKKETDQSFGEWLDLALKLRAARRTVYLVGNGASASMASHMAADLAKNGLLHTEVFTDMSLLTALGNDISYDEVFAEPIRRRMTAGDMLVAISSSGQSPNILRAAEEARRTGGTVVTLSAMKPENTLRTMGNLNYYIPAPTYGLAESGHAAILHYWMDLVESETPKAP